MVGGLSSSNTTNAAVRSTFPPFVDPIPTLLLLCNPPKHVDELGITRAQMIYGAGW